MPDQLHVTRDDFVLPSSERITYFKLGGGTSQTDSKESLAKQVEDEGVFRHYVKKATSGPDSGLMYNPQSANFQEKSHRRESNGRANYEYRYVSRAAFELYLTFLKTGNLVYLRQAERM